MTLEETMIINNMTNVIKNLEQSKRICDIIDDLNKLILTLGGRKHDEPTETKPEQEHVSIKAVTVTPVHIMTETKPKAEPVRNKQRRNQYKNKQRRNACIRKPTRANQYKNKQRRNQPKKN